MRGQSGERREGFSGTTIKNTWTKPRGGVWKQRREVGMAGREGEVGSKCRQLQVNNNKIIFKKRK